MTDQTFIQGTIELLPILPTLAGSPIVPDLVSVVATNTPEGATVFTPASAAVFTTTPLLNGAPAVWVRSLAVGTYRVLCKMNVQSDGQAPIWQLSGAIEVTE